MRAEEEPLETYTVPENIDAPAEEEKSILLACKQNDSEIDAFIAILEAAGHEHAEQLRKNRDLSQLTVGDRLRHAIRMDADGHVVQIKYDSNNMSGQLPNIFGSFPRLEEVSFSGNRLSGAIPDFSGCQYLRKVHFNSNNFAGDIPDFSACTQLSAVRLHKNNLAGEMPSYWPKSLNHLDVSDNPRLTGDIHVGLIVQCSSIDYSNCQQRWDRQLKRVNSHWMAAPFIVGVSFASEDIATLTSTRRAFGIENKMLITSKEKAWQQRWLDGLRELKDRHVIVVAASNNFEAKFKRPTTDEENKKMQFDAKLGLPACQRAACILDWERRHLAMCAAQNNLKIWFTSDAAARVERPRWYPLPEGFRQQGSERGCYYVWTKGTKCSHCW